MKKIISITSALLFMAGVSVAQVAPYQNKELSIEERVEDLMSRMTLDEKISYIHGMRTSGGHSATQWDGTPACERLGIQPLKIYHGPYGVGSYRYTNKNGVYYPSSINMATTWNPELVEEITTSLSRELKAAGGQSSAGPAMNIIRDLRGGRSMEYFTEDPYLNGEIAAAYVKGVQSQRNFAIMKHYLANNQDYLRFGMDTYVSERAIREIYLPGYKAAVEKGGVMGVMTGYNLVNGIHNSAHKHQINEILKGEFGFKGVVMTDWVGSANNGRFMLEAGLDLEMPRALKYKPAAIKELLNKGEIDISLIDEKVRRVLYLTFWCGVMDEKPSINKAEIATPECVAVARRAAEEAIVLLKNEGDILPLDRTKVKKIAVIGPNGEFGAHFRNGQHNYQMLQGGGSATVAPPKGKLITPFVGVKNAAKGIEVNFEAGCYGDHGYTIIQPEFLLSKMGEKGLDATYFSDDNFGGTKANKIDPKVDFRWYNVPDIIERDDSKPNKKFSVKWSGKIVAPETRKYGFELNSVGNATLYINKKKLIDITSSMHAEKYGVGEIELKKGEYEIRIEYQVTANDKELVLKWNYGEEEYLKRAVELAKSSDVVIMAVGTSGSIETEAQDRSILLGRSDYLALSAAQERLIKEIAKVNSKVIVSPFTAGVV
ncbi:MAG: glycoside hydrolase family 3 N-terminal domain-containing protein, partial [Rikenellaceae bacterium]